MAPVLDELAEDKGDEFFMGKVDAASESGFAVDMEISAVPTFVFFVDGEETDRHVGQLSKDAIIAKLG